MKENALGIEAVKGLREIAIFQRVMIGAVIMKEKETIEQNGRVGCEEDFVYRNNGMGEYLSDDRGLFKNREILAKKEKNLILELKFPPNRAKCE